ncbi:MAG: hypothetical protein K2X47_03680 [Bdellovibrionales bacterium]|nr:hypothetical protein [Bdellovibrionales bacterium]
MAMHPDKKIIRHRWMQIKTFLKRGLDQISDEYREKTQGNTDQISGLIRSRHDQNPDEVQRALSEVYSDFLSDPNRRAPTEEEGRMDWEGDGHNISKRSHDSFKGRQFEIY